MSSDRIDALNAEHGLDEAARFDRGQGGLTRLSLACDSARAEVYLQGAHVTAWQPSHTDRPVIWMSGQSQFAPGEPIRGGVPVCFPWFAFEGPSPDGPLHGFARVRDWSVESIRREPDGAVTATLELTDDETTRAAWPHGFTLRHTISVGRELRMALAVTNTGEQPLAITEALHTYLAVSDVRAVALAGLADTEYLDKVDDVRRKLQGAGVVTFEGATDRVYLYTRAQCVLTDPAWGRQIVVGKDGSDTTVVWNPWIEKAAAMPDFGDDEWPGMVCVETANAGENAVTVAPGATHTLAAALAVRPTGG